MKRDFESNSEILGRGTPDPIDNAIHLNTAKEWEEALGEAAADYLPSFDHVIPTAKLLRDHVEDIFKGMH